MTKNIKAKICGLIEEEWETCTQEDPCKMVSKLYEKIRPIGKGSRIWNGYLLEALVVKLLRTKIDPNCIFTNRKIALIDDTTYDITLCATSNNGKTQSPICLSVKTSLRERYKQAEREGLNAKQVHIGSYTALLTMDSKTAEKKGGNMRGLDMVVDCASETSLRAFLEKILDLNPIPYSKIREIGPLISQTKKQQKQKSLI
jgi:hypothetical protein